MTVDVASPAGSDSATASSCRISSARGSKISPPPPAWLPISATPISWAGVRARGQQPDREEPPERARPVLAAPAVQSAAAHEPVRHAPRRNGHVRHVRDVYRQRARRVLRAAAGPTRQMEVSWGQLQRARRGARIPCSRGFIEAAGVLGTLNGTFIFDGRDKPFDASRGWFQSSNVQWGLQAVGSDFDYVRILLRQFYYRAAGPFVFASGVRWGWLHGIGGDPPITIFDRFFDACGSQTVRGYAEESLSAVTVGGFQAGGTKLLILNQEVRFPLFSRWLQGAAFIDAGNTFRRGRRCRSRGWPSAPAWASASSRRSPRSVRPRLPARPAARRPPLPRALLDRSDLEPLMLRNATRPEIRPRWPSGREDPGERSAGSASVSARVSRRSCRTSPRRARCARRRQESR